MNNDYDNQAESRAFAHIQMMREQRQEATTMQTNNQAERQARMEKLNGIFTRAELDKAKKYESMGFWAGVTFILAVIMLITLIIHFILNF